MAESAESSLLVRGPPDGPTDQRLRLRANTGVARRGSRLRPVSAIVGSILIATAVLTVVGLVKAGPHLGSDLSADSFHQDSSWRAVGGDIWRSMEASTLAPYYWLLIGLLSVLQFVWPARRQEAHIGVEMAVDAVWFVLGNALQLTVVAVTLGAVTVAYTEVLGTWSLHLQRYIGHWGLILVAYVFTDALAYATHLCHHKVPTLWRFHSVHHSQQHLNALSDNRTHVGEVMVAALIVFVPSQMLGINAAVATTLAFIGFYYAAMLHSNIRTNLGPLRFVFLGPQPHRVHHSVIPKHFDHNYGTTFPWWDMIFGTYYRDVKVYPPTGITDAAFPLPARGEMNPFKWVAIFVRQVIYPYKAIFRLWVPQKTPTLQASTS